MAVELLITGRHLPHDLATEVRKHFDFLAQVRAALKCRSECPSRLLIQACPSAVLHARTGRGGRVPGQPVLGSNCGDSLLRFPAPDAESMRS